MSSRHAKRRQQPRRVERSRTIRPQPGPRPAPIRRPRRWVQVARQQNQQPAVKAWYCASRPLFQTMATDRERQTLVGWLARWFTPAEVR